MAGFAASLEASVVALLPNRLVAGAGAVDVAGAAVVAVAALLAGAAVEAAAVPNSPPAGLAASVAGFCPNNPPAAGVAVVEAAVVVAVLFPNMLAVGAALVVAPEVAAGAAPNRPLETGAVEDVVAAGLAPKREPAVVAAAG